MLGMHDISAQITRQVQNAWQLDFEQPLVTQSAADRILNSISKMFENSEKPVTSGVYGPGINGPGGTAGLPTLVPSAVGPGASQVSGTGPTPTWTVPSGTRFPIS
jgi:hypothetical protein